MPSIESDIGGSIHANVENNYVHFQSSDIMHDRHYIIWSRVATNIFASKTVKTIQCIHAHYTKTLEIDV